MRKTVCLIGRPNVGKSTIFNRLICEKKSIIMDIPGVTRDRIYGNVNHNEINFLLIDTGGISIGAEIINKDIKMQAEIAINESDVIVFIVDGQEAITANDLAIKEMLIKSGKKVIVAVNKLDNNKMQTENLYDYYTLGFEEIIPISATHNIGFGELLEAITKDFTPSEEPADELLKFCIIGRPNVGKSSLINALLNEERVIVSPIAGTTRDAIDTRFSYEKKDYIVIDTAGMRKKGRIYEDLEKYSLIRSLKAIDRSNVCVIVINAEEGIIEHDKHIASYAIEAGKGIVLAINKWDLMTDPNLDIKKWQKKIADNFQFIPYAKIVFLSAKTKKRVHTLMPEVIKAYENACQEIKTSLLNNVIVDAVSLHQPPSYKGRRLKIFFSSQAGTKPPKFILRVNDKGLVHFSYERYLENVIRDNFDLTGTPIIIQFKNKNDLD